VRLIVSAELEEIIRIISIVAAAGLAKTCISSECRIQFIRNDILMSVMQVGFNDGLVSILYNSLMIPIISLSLNG
jgi:hypothetical protein